MSTTNPLSLAFVSRVRNPNVMRASLWLHAYASGPTIVIAAILLFLLAKMSPEAYATIGSGKGQQNLDWFPALVFNPIVESLMLVGMIRLCAKKSYMLALIVPAVLLSALHSLQSPLWGVTVVTFFLIQSYAFLEMDKSGFAKALAVLVISHSLHNGWSLGVRYFIA